MKGVTTPMMNRILDRRVAGILVINMFLAIIAPPAWAQGANTQVLARHRATITAVDGTVEVKTVGTTAWVKAAANREVKTGDKIRTAARSSCKIKVADVGNFDVGASSEISVGNLQQVKTSARAFFMFQREITRDDVGVDLKSGDMRSGFHRREGRVGNYNVYTPVAVAGVRGTQFELDLDGAKPWYEQMGEGKGDGDEQSLTAAVLEGHVELIGEGWNRDILTGQQLTAMTGRIPGQPGIADANRLRGIGEAVGAPKDAKAPIFNGAILATRPTPTTVNVTWAAASDDSSPAEKIVYDIALANSSASQDFAVPAATTEGGATEFTLTGLDANVNYFLIVRARDEAGNSDLNTKEVSTVVGDATAPEFAGVDKVSKPTPTSAELAWPNASDNKTASEKIGYDIYWSTTSNGQDFTKPSATTEPGATSFTVVGLEDQTPYYFVVRSRDLAGNRDPNKKEVSTIPDVAVVDTFDTNVEITKLTGLLFDYYANKRSGDFMDLTGVNFSGVNNSGNALTYATLAESLNSDFELLSSAEFAVAFTSITPFGDNQYGVDVNWNARYRFLTMDTEITKQGVTTSFIWSGDERQYRLTNWAGGVPFGLSNPGTDILLLPTDDEGIPSDTVPPDNNSFAPPKITSLTGPTSFTLTGNFQDFAPFRYTLTGTDFQSGAVVEHFDPYYSIWENVATPNNGMLASVFFSSPTELLIDYSQFIAQYVPSTSTAELFRVINPDGQISAEFSEPFTFNPGPLNLTSLATDRPVQNTADPNSYTFTLDGYNIVLPLQSITFLKPDGFTPEPNIVLNAGSDNVQGASPGNPMTLTFQATVGGGGILPGNNIVRVRNALGTQFDKTFTVQNNTNILWTTNQNLASGFTVPIGSTLTIDPGVIVSGGAPVTVAGTLIANGASFSGIDIHFTGSGNGTLTNVSGTMSGVAALHHQSSGLVQISGGSYSSTGTAISVDGGGTLDISGATVSGGSDGIFVGTASTVNINAGTIIQSATKGVNIGDGTAVLSGGTIQNNTTYGVYLSLGTFNFSSGAISSNGVGVNPAGGAFNMSGGMISGSTGTGVLVSGGSVNITGGTIQNSGGAGISVSAGPTISISNADILGNSGFGVDRPSPGSGPITLSSVKLNGNAGLTGSDMDTALPGNSPSPGVNQYNGLINVSDLITSPRP